MSRRRGFLVSHKIPFEGSPPPNQTQDFITIEIRAFWPHNAAEQTVGALLSGCYLEAVRALQAKMAGSSPPNTWLSPPEAPTGPTTA